MSSEQRILEDRYTHGKPFVRAKVVVVNPYTGRQTTIEEDFWIDTGFDGGIHLAQLHMSEITPIGVDLRPGPIAVAGGGISRNAYRCFAYLQQIGDHELPQPGIEAELVLHGSSRYGLLGLEILKHWIIRFNGPDEFFAITEKE